MSSPYHGKVPRQKVDRFPVEIRRAPVTIVQYLANVDSTRVQLRGSKEIGNCCSSDYQDHEHQHILNHIAPLQSVHHVNNDSESRIVSVLTIDKHTEYFLLQEVLKCFTDFSSWETYCGCPAIASLVC
ncbi:hypothetical protein IMY05_005G0188500 [Salix suchowensis]|nr:hypothetical protein IMY05_005G0188500 [Salix suchowensis]